jgi:hypothetical protein
LRAARATALVLASVAVLSLAGGGCAGGSTTGTASRAELTLQRSQLVKVVEGLRFVAPAVRREVGAARGAWPSLAAGLPSRPRASLRAQAERAAALAGEVPEPRFMSEASKLTGPPAGIAGLYEAFARLSERGWRLTGNAIATVLSGSPAAARFARQNAPLYIDAIYDGHYDLSLLGKALTKGYGRLGGGQAFGERLSQATVDSLVRTYSIAAVRLAPHPGHSGELS